MNRREFLQSLPYVAGGIIIPYIAHKSYYREPSRERFEIEPGVDLEIREGGVLLNIRHINKREISELILNQKIKISGKTYVFERYLEESDTKQIFIALLERSNNTIYFQPKGREDYESINSFRNKFRKEDEFYYLGDRGRTKQLFNQYFKAIKEMYNTEILIAAPKIIEGRRDHSSVFHIWSDVDIERKAILYRDNNTDPAVIRRNVDKLLKQIENGAAGI